MNPRRRYVVMAAFCSCALSCIGRTGIVPDRTVDEASSPAGPDADTSGRSDGTTSGDPGCLSACGADGLDPLTDGGPTDSDGDDATTSDVDPDGADNGDRDAGDFGTGGSDSGGGGLHAVDDSLSTVEDTATDLAVLANDDCPVGRTLLITAMHGGAGTLSTDGLVVHYMPPVDFSGIDSFTYDVGDGIATATGLVTVSVVAVNDAPLPANDSASTFDCIPVDIFVLANDDDIEGDSLAVLSIDTPSSGSATTDGTKVTYTPAIGFAGVVHVAYQVTDGSDSASADIAITVTRGVLVSGTLSGLAGGSVGVSLNGSQTLSLSANGAFTFNTGLPVDAAFELSVTEQPTSPAQWCEAPCARGIAATDVSWLQVVCHTASRVLQMAAGYAHTCAVLDDGSLRCWGDNAFGQLGVGDLLHRGDAPAEMGDNLPAVPLGTGRTVTAVAVGMQYACALLDNATVKCWGYNPIGQLGYGDTTSRYSAAQMGDSLPAVQLGTGRTVLSLGASGNHTCVRLNGGDVKCWGDNSFGQLGLGVTTTYIGDNAGEMGNSLATVSLGTGRTATALAVGSSHTCALLDNSSVKCWGSNGNGQLGYGDTTNRGTAAGQMGNSLPAVALGTGRTAVAIAAGANYTCALLDNSTVKCWGSNVAGQLGLGVTTDSVGDGPGEMGAALPVVQLGAGRTVVAVAVGSLHSCAVLDNGAVKCWGFNFSGQLGLGDETTRGIAATEMGDSLPAVSLGSGRSATAVAASGMTSCARLDNGAVKCWGHAGAGELGIGTPQQQGDRSVYGVMLGDSLPPVPLLGTATGVAAGIDFSCALLSGGGVKCWGENEQGQLGVGSTVHCGRGAFGMGDLLPVVDVSR